MLPASTSFRANRWYFPTAVATIALIVTVLYGLMSYSAGYNETRVSVFAFARAMWKLEDWEHCMLVPVAIAIIIYLDRKKLALLPVRGAWVGLVAVVAALGIFWFGYQADIIYFGYISAQLMVAGLIVFFLGWEWMKALAFPWMFMVFMWPLLFLGDNIAFPLRIIMSKTSVFVLNFIGIPTTLSGTAILSSPDALTGRPMGKLFSVDVANPCSGIRSLFALMMVSALYGHFTVTGWWKKWIIFLCSMPLAVLGNLCRIVMLTFGTIALGSEVAIGSEEDPSFFHLLSGYLVFAVALLGLIGISTMLNTKWKRLNFTPRPPESGVKTRVPPRFSQDAY